MKHFVIFKTAAETAQFSHNNSLLFLPGRTLRRFAGVMVWALIIFAGQSFAQHSLLDPSFDGDGKTFAQFLPTNNVAYNSVLQPDGKIVVVGSASAGPTSPQNVQAAVVRFNADGSLDTTFDGDGKVSVILSSSLPSTLWAAAVQSDGKIVAVGRIGIIDGTTSNGSSAVILRFNPDGSLDNTFDGDGKRTLSFSLYTVGSDLAIQPDGKIIMAGNTEGFNVHDFYVARFNSDGSFDASFGTNSGYTRTSLNSNLVEPKMALLADGKIVMTSARYSPFQTVRYTANGLIDTTFGTNGRLDNIGGNAIIQQPDDGKIIILQNTLPNFPVFLWRLNYDGTLDSTFGSNGIRIFTWSNNHDRLEPEPEYDIALDAVGKIIIGGSVRFKTTLDHQDNGPTRDFALARLNRDGSDDFYFGFRGRLTTEMSGTDPGKSLLIQPDGKIVLAGDSTNGGFAVARYIPGIANKSCRPVGDFNGDGKSDLAYIHNGVNNAEWFFRSTLNNSILSRGWGQWTDTIVPADYNGDCYTDYAFYHDGNWEILSPIDTVILPSYQVGGEVGDIPVPADYDGDDWADPAVYRNGTWIIKQTRGEPLTVQFGLAGDIPVPADYDGDGKDDVAVFRPSDGTWYLAQSTLGIGIVRWGTAGDKPVVGDYDGDGKSDLAVYRPSDGTWYLLQSTLGSGGVRWGISTDKPVPADYDGDGKTDIAVYRDGAWYLLQTTLGYQLKQFGSTADRPIQNAFIQ